MNQTTQTRRKQQQPLTGEAMAWTRGLAGALATMQRCWHTSDLVVQVLREQGLRLDDLLDCDVPDADLRHVFDAHVSHGNAEQKARAMQLLEQLQES